LAGTRKKRKPNNGFKLPESKHIEDDNEVTLAFIEGYSFSSVFTGCCEHIGTRNYQEDSCYVTEAPASGENAVSKAFGIVCDGMGGLENGSKASRLATDLMRDVMERIKADDNIEAVLINEIYRIDSCVNKECATENGGGGGTTLVAALILGRNLHWVGVGDSRVYIMRGREIVQVTQDHTYEMQLRKSVEEGLLPQEVADEHPQRNALISYIGSGNVQHINTNKAGLEMMHGDIVLLCSDGLVKSLADERIADIVYANYGDMKEAAKQLTLRSFDSSDGSKDNTTVVLMQFVE